MTDKGKHSLRYTLSGGHPRFGGLRATKRVYHLFTRETEGVSLGV